MVINVEIAGPSDAQPLVLVHGAGGSAATWFMQLRGLSKHFLVHAIELNGHGKSKDRAEPDTGQSYLDDISSIVNELDHPIVGGHSMGGALTQLFALQKSDSVRGIVLVGTGARLRVNPLIFEWLKTEFETYIQALGEFVFDKSADERLVQASMKEARRCSPHIISRDFAFCNEFDIMDRVLLFAPLSSVLDRLENQVYRIPPRSATWRALNRDSLQLFARKRFITPFQHSCRANNWRLSLTVVLNSVSRLSV